MPFTRELDGDLLRPLEPEIEIENRKDNDVVVTIRLGGLDGLPLRALRSSVRRNQFAMDVVQNIGKGGLELADVRALSPRDFSNPSEKRQDPGEFASGKQHIRFPSSHHDPPGALGAIARDVFFEFLPEPLQSTDNVAHLFA